MREKGGERGKGDNSSYIVNKGFKREGEGEGRRQRDIYTGGERGRVCERGGEWGDRV